MNKIVITLPLPNRVLLPNRSKGLHWSKTSGAKAKARRDGYFAAIHAENEQGRFFAESPTIRFRWYSRSKIHPDPDAVISSQKSTVDGLADAGLFGNDKNLKMGGVEFAVDKSDPRLEIELEAS